LKSGRIIGIFALIAGAALGLIGALWLVTVDLGTAARVLGLGLLSVVVLPLLGAGVFLLVRSGQEAKAGVETAQMRKILDVVKSRGEVPLSDLTLELNSNRDQVKNWIYSLVGMGIFSGYINWDEGVLYSTDASQLRGLERCRHCGGEVKLAGKGVVTCPYCGTEYFLN